MNAPDNVNLEALYIYRKFEWYSLTIQSNQNNKTFQA